MLLGMRQGLTGSDPSPVINWDFLQSQSLTSFSRTSNATLFDSTGKLTYAANNLLLRSQEFQTTWTRQGVDAFGSGSTADAAIAPDGTTTADLIKATAGAGRHQVVQSFAGTIGQRFVISVYVKAGTSVYPYVTGYDGGSTWATAVFDISSASTTASQTAAFQTTILGTSKQSVGNDWYRISIAFSLNVSTAPNIGIGFAAAATGNTINAPTAGLPEFTATGNETLYFWGAQVEAVTYQTTPSTYNPTTTAPYYGPRYPYAYNGTTWDAQGLLVEAAGTNNLQYSETFSTAWWTQSGVTLSGPAITAPNGVSTSTRWNTASGYSGVFRQTNLGLTTGTYTYSFFIKPNGTNSVQFWVYDGTSTFLTVDCNGSNGTYTVASGSGIVSSKNVSGGWYRFVITFNGAVNQIGFQTFAATNLYIWGAQLEAGDLSSYIPNLATGTTTRNADTSLAFSAISLPTGLSFSRASNAMQYDAAGRLTYAPNNLLTYSNDFSNTAWTKSATGTGVVPTVTYNYATASNGNPATRVQMNLGATPASAGSRVIQSLGASPSGTAVVTLWLRSTDGASAYTIYIWFPAGPVVVDVTGTWTQVSYTTGSSFSNLQFGLTGASGYVGVTTSTSADILVSTASVSNVTYETVARPCDQLITTTDPKYGPRYDYDPLTRLPKGLLIEEGRTNIAGNTDILGIASWTPYGSSRSGTVTGPNGVANSAQTITASAGGTYHQIQSATIGSTTPNANYTLSVYAKAGTTSFACVNLYSTTQNFVSAVFNLNDTTATIASDTKLGTTSGTLVSTRQLYIGNGWFRLSVTGSFNRSDITPLFCIANAATGNTFDQYGEPTFSATGNETISLFGAQLEAGSFPTSYIPNPGIASGIRSADISTLTGTALTTLQGSAWSLASEISNVSGTPYPIIVGQSNGSTVAPLYLGQSENKLFAYSFSTAVGTANTATWSGINRGASSTNSDGRSLVLNGGTVAKDATSMTNSVTMTIGSWNNSAQFLNGYFRKFAVWNVKLADAKLQQKSVVGATL